VEFGLLMLEFMGYFRSGETMTYSDTIAKEIGVRPDQTAAAIELIDAGNTIPFIARYRKEATGVLDEEQLRQIFELLAKKRSLDERRATIRATIEGQGKLTDELRSQIEKASTLSALEDLYQPYKPKRRTRAMIAREKGLQGLADLILAQARTNTSLENHVRAFLSDEVPTVDDALAGARDIVAETISDHAVVRSQTREKALEWGTLRCEKIENADDPRKVYETYYAFEGRVNRLRPHQILAMDRGEKEKVLRVKVGVDERDWQGAMAYGFRVDMRSPFSGQMQLAMADAAERLLLPAIERDVRRELSEKAGLHAIGVFATNLRALLSQPPMNGQVVLGIDPGFRTGSKIAVVDPTGKVLATGTIYPHEPHKKWNEALEVLKSLVSKHKVNLISIGNGTASRETEQLAAQLIHEVGAGLQYLITNEAGASVYSASPLARAELPDLDVSIRGAVSIARRVQDALAELVKIDPKSIGVGLYQHDVDQPELNRTVAGVVESVVNRVGVDVNTASPALLAYVAGIGAKLAEKIVAYRDENGTFDSRVALKKVAGLGPKAFEQAAGFLRINQGKNPLDASAIHPESYPIAEAVLDRAGITKEMRANRRLEVIETYAKNHSPTLIAEELGVGEPTLVDIFEQLIRPGRDPRQDMPVPILRSDVMKIDDLTPGMRLKGTVRNVVDFGAFIDIGVKQDGLLHHSQLPRGVVLEVGNILLVEVQKIEIDRGRISLGWIE
jgi:protein Tex